MTKTLRVFAPLGAIVLALAMEPQALAQSWGMSEGTLDQLSFDATQSLLMRRVVHDVGKGPRKSRRGTTSETRPGSLLARPSSAGPRMPRRLAAAYPKASRAEAERVLLRTLEAYHQIERRLGVEKHDAAGAMAAFVAGTYMAWNDVDVPDDHFRVLVAQLRGSLGANESFLRASDAQKQEIYESLAIAGTYLALTREALKARPDEATRGALKATARSYVKQLFGVEPDQLALTSDGLSIRARP